MLKVPPCPDCGPSPVFHEVEYISALVSRVVRIFEKPGEWCWKIIGPLVGPFIFGILGTLFLKFLILIRVGTLTKTPDKTDSFRTKVLWEEAIARGIYMREFHLLGQSGNIFLATYAGRTISFQGLPRPVVCDERVPSWMDNKDIMRAKFTAAGIPVAKGDVCFSWKKTQALFNTLEKPVIIKPHVGSRSRHTTTHITDKAKLWEAFKKAKQLSPWIILEEELEGSVFRGTIVHEKLVAVLRRDPPYVIGDGERNIRALVEEENKKPLRQGPIFHHIAIDKDADAELARQRLTWESTPPSGVRITFNQKVGRGQGAVNVDVTDTVHPDNKELLEYASRIVDDPLIGIDFIMKDGTRSWKEQPRSGIIECNGLPFIDLHHYPFEGEPRNVAGALWDIVFPKSKGKKS